VRVTVDGNVVRGSHISGPTHNALVLTIDRGAPSDQFEVSVVPREPLCCGPPLTAELVRPWIVEGVRMACDELKARYTVTMAEIVENDTPRQHVYVAMARHMILARHRSESVEAQPTR